MASVKSVTELRDAANRALDQLAGLNADVALTDAKQLVEDLRNARQYEPMARVAEAISRIDPKDAKNRRLYAQSLIETGKASVAIDVLQALVRRLPKAHPESVEALGLLGRANKQMFFDARDKASVGARQSLKQAIAAYRKPFEENPSNTWHGVNLIALLANSRRLGIPVASGLKPRAIATQVVSSLEAVPKKWSAPWAPTPPHRTPRHFSSPVRCDSSRRSGIWSNRSVVAAWSTLCERAYWNCEAASW
jgi:tetratricopeptide (TPR) repeat protein